MAFQPVLNTVALNVRWLNDIDFWGENTLAFIRNSGSITTTNMNLLMDAFEDVWVSHWDALTNDNVGPVQLTVRSLESEMGPIVTRGVALVGNQASQPLPPNATIAVSLRTEFAGRSYRGRVFQCGLTEAMVAGKRLVSPYDADIPASWEAFRVAALADGWTLAVVSRVQNGVLMAEGIATPVTDILLTDTRTDSMKTRLKD